MGSPLMYTRDGAIATITLNRPAQRNALTPEMLCRLADALVDFGSDDALRVLILTGAGEQAFCAGGDLATTLPLLSGDRAPTDAWDRRFLEDPVVAAASALRGFDLVKPIVAAVNGACMAAGAELLLGTDIRVVADHARFAWPEVTRGVIPFAGSMVRLPRQLSYCQAMALMLTGDTIDAPEALRIGLVNRVVPAGELMATAMSLARRVADNAPFAVQQVKRTALACTGLPLQQGYALENEAKRSVFASDDAREGPRAFIEGRPPRFLGR